MVLQGAELKRHVDATLGRGNVYEAVRLPEGEDIREWLAVNTVDLYNAISVLHMALEEYCTDETCRTMSAGPKVQSLPPPPPSNTCASGTYPISEFQFKVPEFNDLFGTDSFVLCALHLSEWRQACHALHCFLKACPPDIVVFYTVEKNETEHATGNHCVRDAVRVPLGGWGEGQEASQAHSASVH
jgi:hypothetical protein